MLHAFLTDHHEEIATRCQEKVGARRPPESSDPEVDHGVPLFLSQLIDSLCPEPHATSTMGESATKHGNELLRRGYTVDQVVHDYGDVCQAVTELAGERSVRISTGEFRILNKCLDDAIAGAVTEYARQHDQCVADEHAERLGVLAHEMRNLVNDASLAFVAISTGVVGIGGSTGAVLERALTGLRRLVDRSLTDVRLEVGKQDPQPVPLSVFVEEVRVSATMEAKTRGVQLTVTPVDDGLVVQVDRQTLASVLGNLLQNACKFSKPGGTVTLKAHGIADRVLIEVADECGGLPPGMAEERFRAFEQRGTDRTGLGLGLTICLRGVEANGGTLHVRDVPGRGCVFTVELPKARLAAS